MWRGLTRRLLHGAMTPAMALKILSLSPGAELTAASIKKAYIRKVLECHPDLHQNDPNANDNFRDLSDALRVTLKALECHALGVGLGNSSLDTDGGGVYDSHTALESLRQAIISYRRHKNNGTDAADGTKADDAFYTPSLEYISDVCQQEHLAMRRVRTFCDELPSVLCGSASCTLFESVAFFYTRHVASMATCVLRFSKNLPVIVHRVVRNRQRYIKYNRHDKLSSGFGTTSRPQEQRIEKMSMKPLVLMGALIFDLSPDGPMRHDTIISSTCGVSSRRDIRVTEELQCVIYPSDSIAIITEKMGQWEAASLARLKVELAMVDVCTLLSSLLGLDTVSHPLVVPPHLQLSQTETERILFHLQHVAAEACGNCGESPREIDRQGIVDQLIAAAKETEVSTDLSGGLEVVPPPPEHAAQLLAECRELAQVAAEYIEGNISLYWSDGHDHVQAPPSPLAAPQKSSAEGAATPTGGSDGKTEPQPQPQQTLPANSFHVARHPSCCIAETIRYAVSIRIDKDCCRFAAAVRASLARVIVEAELSKQVLGELLTCREATTAEEFIPLAPIQQQLPLDEVGSGDDEDNRRYRYRGPIQVFPRLFNMNTARELTFWHRVHTEREYIARHAAAMSPLNVFFGCLPYDGQLGGPGIPTPSLAETDLPIGWIGEDRNGADNVVLGKAHLEDATLFGRWLEEVVEQSTLNKVCQTTLDDIGVGYVSRDPSLPVVDFLSFLKVFSKATAVRSVIEGRQHQTTTTAITSKSRVTTTEHVGLHLIVGTRCDVCNGGQLMVPWHIDPSILLVLLGGHSPQDAIEGVTS